MIGALPQSFNGMLRASRYAFGPNRLHYCGPDANREIFDYIDAGASDPGLEVLLKGFQTMYPYLSHIADANGIPDPFDNRVVEAYWIGNELLETIEQKKIWGHLTENLKLQKKIGSKSMELVADKIRRDAVPHHSFHVFDIWKRTGHLEERHTLESMDKCRVSWGKIVSNDGPKIMVKRQALAYLGGKLILEEAALEKITKNLEADIEIDEIKAGDLVSIHWGVICEKITPHQKATLKKYTLRHLALANQTI